MRAVCIGSTSAVDGAINELRVKRITRGSRGVNWGRARTIKRGGGAERGGGGEMEREEEVQTGREAGRQKIGQSKEGAGKKKRENEEGVEEREGGRGNSAGMFLYLPASDCSCEGSCASTFGTFDESKAA